MLPSKKLVPYYKKVTWLFVSRNFKKDVKDIVAIRSHDRFGISSWPQMFVFDGRDDRILQEMPRNLDGFIRGLETSIFRYAERKSASIEGTRVGASGKKDTYERTLALEALLVQQANGTTVTQEDLDKAQGLLLLGSADIVVRLRALRLLSVTRPDVILGNAYKLLEVANDPWRYEILAVITRNGSRKPVSKGASAKQRVGSQGSIRELTETLTELYKQAGNKVPSRNPNVLRIRVAECLGAIGDFQALEVLASTAREASPRNGLTHVAIRSIAAIGRRSEEEGRRKSIEILSEALPPAVAPSSDLEDKAATLATRRALGVIRTTLKALATLVSASDLPAMPVSWTSEDRRALRRELQKLTRTK